MVIQDILLTGGARPRLLCGSCNGHAARWKTAGGADHDIRFSHTHHHQRCTADDGAPRGYSQCAGLYCYRIRFAPAPCDGLRPLKLHPSNRASCPRPLIRNARVDYNALASEGLSYEELLAGLRKLGYSSPEGIESPRSKRQDTSVRFL